MIRVHSVCFYDKISLKFILIHAADILSRHFLDKKHSRDKGLYLGNDCIIHGIYNKNNLCPDSSVNSDYNFIKSVPNSLNSHVSPSTNPCIKKEIHMLLMHRFGTLNTLVLGHYILQQIIYLMPWPWSMNINEK